MGMWNPWRGCHRYSTGCKYCYIHKGDYRKGNHLCIITERRQRKMISPLSSRQLKYLK